jgi:hypothetical protein
MCGDHLLSDILHERGLTGQLWERSALKNCSAADRVLYSGQTVPAFRVADNMHGAY